MQYANESDFIAPSELRASYRSGPRCDDDEAMESPDAAYWQRVSLPVEQSPDPLSVAEGKGLEKQSRQVNPSGDVVAAMSDGEQLPRQGNAPRSGGRAWWRPTRYGVVRDPRFFLTGSPHLWEQRRSIHTSPDAETSEETKQKQKEANRSKHSKEQLLVNPEKQHRHSPDSEGKAGGRSILVADAQSLLDEFGGDPNNEAVGKSGRGEAGFKERFNAGKAIGHYVDPVSGEAVPTTVGIIHYGKTGSHIVPARPKQ